ncbi:MAG: hypothetical protein ACXQS5_04380 [Candidatus Methanospirareceae archaeon]
MSEKVNRSFGNCWTASVVKNALFDEVENLVDKTGQKIPPVNPEIVAKERKVIEIERVALDTDALIL